MPDADFTLERVNRLADARADWTRLAERGGNVFATWEWADAWLRHLGAVEELSVALVRAADGSVIGVLPLCLTRARPVRLLRLLGAGPSDQMGPVCAPGDRQVVTRALRRHATEALSGSGIFLAERLPAEENFGDHLGLAPLRSSSSPMLAIDGRSFEDFLASRSRNFRDQVRRRERNLMRDHRVVYRLTDDPERLENDMGTLVRLHQARWSEGESEALSGAYADFHLDFARAALERGWLRLWTLELDDRPVAAWYGLRFGGVEFYYQAGRDPAYERLNVGFVLLCHTIRSAFEDGMRAYRFGHGDEPYKSRFADSDPGLETFVIARGVRGRLALAGLRTIFRLPHASRGALLRAGLPVRS